MTQYYISCLIELGPTLAMLGALVLAILAVNRRTEGSLSRQYELFEDGNKQTKSIALSSLQRGLAAADPGSYTDIKLV